MVSSVWQWDLTFMLTHFGEKAALAIALNTGLLVWLFRQDLPFHP